MHSMQGPAGENEPLAPEDDRTSQNAVIEAIAWSIRLAALLWLAQLLIYALRNPESVRLHLLWSLLVWLRRMNIVLGSLALVVENTYNNTVTSLH